MKYKNVIFSYLCFLILLLASCKSKATDEKPSGTPTPEFSTELPDGEYLVDSSSGIKTYAIVQTKKLKKFRAVTADGKPSKTGTINLKMRRQLTGDNDIPTLPPCPRPCWVACVIDIFTGKDAYCTCICPTNNPGGNNWGMLSPEILGPSFGNTKINEVKTKVVFEINP